ncbi:MAG: NlpC/P60 family protein [Thermomicrobiales bacterium]|nr:NlpC/P60 family protein [Thermomicrobiales bacterium]MCO5218121.1 NlpC/P60 family protein [Thermomicrobiales bacterium]MCO5225558.1 NlpC/P60 family protein [Thermomicrobiales bacterium]MCO5227238.1 NlpC/P60 family protein [Thermomicrobiales bacterium]
MSTLRLRMRTLFSALMALAVIAATIAPLVPVQRAAAEQIDVMAIDQVYVRSGPSTADAILGELHYGDWVTTTGWETNGFVEIWYGDWVGYVYADYLDYAPSTSSSTTTTEAVASSETWWESDGWMYTNDSVNLRTGPSTSDGIVTVVPAGTSIYRTGKITNGFAEVDSDYGAGWIHNDYLSWNAPSASVTTEQVAATSNTTWESDGWLYASSNVNLRVGPSTNDGIVTVVPAGTSIYRTGKMSNGFAEVESDYGSGWIHNDYLTWDKPVAEVVVETTQGQKMVNFAMQYLGYPYVWAGNTPRGFDCSGFTQYVVQNVLGKDITHSADIQATRGTAVKWGDWQVGDLIFFTNTGGSGYYSHVGIYIGDGQMIHAENPGTGVVISSLYSSYYSSHYAYAVRL